MVELVVAEPESAALRAWLLAPRREIVACDLVRTEFFRVIRRVAPEVMVQARRVLEMITLVQVSTSMFESAGREDPVDLRSLEAVRLAAALEIGDDLEGVFTYDEQLAAAANLRGIRTVAPT